MVIALAVEDFKYMLVGNKALFESPRAGPTVAAQP